MRGDGKEKPPIIRKVLEARRRSRVARHPMVFGSEVLRKRLETLDDKRRLMDLRDGMDVCWASEDEAEPLVTIRIATYNRGKLIADRALASAISQSYPNLEILVVGDHCDEATERAVLSVKDPRVRFVNLPERGRYPTDPVYRWMVAGAAPMNAALAIAEGKWIAPCDDDDELTEDHVEVLLKEALARRLEFVWSAARQEVTPGQWRIVGNGSFHQGSFTHGSVLYSSLLRFFRHNDTSWKLMQPGDWDLWWRMHRAGVKMGFVDHVTYVHYAEAQWRN
jgi:glycosyltransferase involved in cell wall biosynthesis